MQTVWQRRVFISLGILIENLFVRFGPGFPNKTYKKRFGIQNLWFTGQGRGFEPHIGRSIFGIIEQVADISSPFTNIVD